MRLTPRQQVLVKQAIIDTLDDEDGVGENAYMSLHTMADHVLDDAGREIFLLVDATDGRFYLGHESADMLRRLTGN